MKKPIRRSATLAWSCLIVLFLVSCASTSYIGIDYRLPPAAGSLQGKTIFIQVSDRRTPVQTLAPSAREDFEHFTGLFSLSVEKTGQKPIIVGAYDVPALFQTAFTQRLEQLGAVVAKAAGGGAIPIDIGIEEFVLERKGRQYLARLSYSATLVHPAGKSVTKTVSGSAERIKITGKRDMETLLGEIFTDMVNRLDVSGLVSEGGY